MNAYEEVIDELPDDTSPDMIGGCVNKNVDYKDKII